VKNTDYQRLIKRLKLRNHHSLNFLFIIIFIVFNVLAECCSLCLQKFYWWSQTFTDIWWCSV